MSGCGYLGFGACFLFAHCLLASPHALIVTGLSGSSENTEEFLRLAGETQRLLVARGLPAENVEVMDGKVTRETVLQKMKESQGAGSEDEYWLVLYGHSGRTQGNVPAFQVSGPRLTAVDLKQALDAIPGRQFVFIGTGDSGGYLPVLQDKRRTVIAATKAEGEADQPRYPDAWTKAFGENPKAAFPWIAARASELVDEEYKRDSLALAEHARLADPVTGAILEPPFGVNLLAPAESAPAAPGPAVSMPVSDIQVKTNDPNAVWEHQPATAETKGLIAAGRAAPNPEGYPAVVLEQRMGFTVEEDRTTDRLVYFRVYLAREDAVEEWANQFLEQSPPAVTTKLQVARVIQPDGSSIVFNPAKLPAIVDPTSGASQEMQMVFLPNTHAGCLVEFGYRTRQLLNASMPEVSENLPIQRRAPVLASEVEVRTPEKEAYHVVLKNDPHAAVETIENGRRVDRWTLGGLPAMESLRADPPWEAWTTWVGVSSLPSWDKFAEWYRRIAKGSDVIDEPVRKMALDLTKEAGTRKEKIQRLFEYVSALRYVAIEIGVQGFRPRTPGEVLANHYGDCKDKANLLVAMLKSVDIDARFVLVNRGGMTDVSFPSWQFNHAICFVPGTGTDNPEMWLDSTDSITPFGYIPPGDAGRPGLVFGKDKAEFRTIAGAGGGVSTLADAWELREDASGGWAGTYERNATGLAEYGLRAAFRGLGPLQREDRICQMASALWPGADFTKTAVSDVSALGQPVEVRAQVSSSRPDLPLPEFPWLDVFNGTTRDRPVWLNDGQPFTGTQTVRLHYASQTPTALPEPLQLDAAGETLSVVWRKVDDKTAERVARVEVKAPIVPTENYAGLRQALRQWSAATR